MASIEFVFEPRLSGSYGSDVYKGVVRAGEESDHEMRMKLVKEAEEWEREAKRRKMAAMPTKEVILEQTIESVEA